MKFEELVKELDKIGSDDPKNEASIILESLFGGSYADVLLDRGREYDFEKIKPIIEKRAQRIPLQYALGKWSFMGEELLVCEDCLIPRPDTEILVYEAIRLLSPNARVADLCTGSGCIGLSLLKQRGDIDSMVLVDICEKALNVARQNAKLLGVDGKCTLLLGDITREFPKGIFDMIVSNPPYIPSSDIQLLSEEVRHEPIKALDGGESGLDIVLPLIDNAKNALSPNGYLLMEFGYDQGEKIKEIMDERLKKGAYRSYKIVKDYGGNDRVLVAQR